MTATRFTYPAAEKLKSRKLIQLLFATGKTMHVPLLTCHYLPAPPAIPVSLQAGVGVSTRHFKKATDRNRIKRLLREAYRLHKHELQETLNSQQQKMAIFLIYTGKELPSFPVVENAVRAILQQAIRRMSPRKDA
jgi:ribonuclease P protein component